jgi:nucleoside-diphosphate-sugar epimerase/ferredoxin
MLDAGLTLEPDIQEVVTRMKGLDKSLWRPEDLEVIRGRMQATSDGVPLKYAFGSDFPYRGAEEGLALVRRNAGLQPSFARGGLSNLWGGAILANSNEDITDWPVSLKDLEPHYRALHDFMPLAGARDELELSFPLYADPVELPVSRQADRLLRDLRKAEVPGISFGRSRLAVNKGCVACGLCLYGCPYGLIYNTAETLSELCSRPNFSYLPATIVRRVEETGQGVIIEAENSDGTARFHADALFLAAGALSSTRIILQSLEAYEHSVPLLNSQYFLFPLLRSERTPGAVSEELHSLAQVFLEISDSELSPHTVHLQCYTYNDLFRKALQQPLGSLAKLLPLEPIVERLLLVQGYLHSNHSTPMHLTLRRDSLELSGQPDAHIRGIITGVMKKLRAIGLPFAPKIGIPGQGFHSGGSLPMRHAPAPFESDIWGRPAGFAKVHVVDAAVLPSIPATTVTYTAMANAHRIASEYTATPRTSRTKQRCAVTGATGYVGKAIAAYLREQGLEVIPLAREVIGAGREYSLEGPVTPETLKGIDLLVHAAYDFAITDEDSLQRVNVEGSSRLFAAAKEAGVKKIVLISSQSAFAGCRSAYGRTKLAIETVATAYGAAIIRPGLVYGSMPGGMVGALRRLSGKKIVPVAGNGGQLLYLTHQEDLGRLVHYLLTTQSALPEGPIAAAAAKPLSIREIIDRLAGRSHVFIPIAAPVLLNGLRLLEALGHSSRLRSDSLVSLLTPAPPPDFSPLVATGVTFRPFAPHAPHQKVNP